MTRDAQYHCLVFAGLAGAGKTSAMLRIAMGLAQKGQRVGVVGEAPQLHSNDLPPTPPWSAATTEAPYRIYHSVHAAAARVAHDGVEVLLIETPEWADKIVATWLYPLRRNLPDKWRNPVVSAILSLDLAHTAGFDTRELVTRAPALSEASAIVLNQVDLATPNEVERIRRAIESEFPASSIFNASVSHGVGFGQWLDYLLQATPPEKAPQHSATLSELAWLNCTIQLSAPDYFDSNLALAHFAGTLRSVVEKESGRVPELRLELHPTDGLEALGRMFFERGKTAPIRLETLPEPIESGELTVNVRGCASFDLLENAVTTALNQFVEERAGVFARFVHSERLA
ncbi:MAG TPA: hypothetical protein VEH27_14665 [Methylomirabilota bacterium]|nr:hypothetical protein [Methylomirabilota bacterium]